MTKITPEEKKFADDLFGVTVRNNQFNSKFDEGKFRMIFRNALDDLLNERQDGGVILTSKVKKESIDQALKYALEGVLKIEESDLFIPSMSFPIATSGGSEPVFPPSEPTIVMPIANPPMPVSPSPSELSGTAQWLNAKAAKTVADELVEAGNERGIIFDPSKTVCMDILARTVEDNEVQTIETARLYYPEILDKLAQAQQTASQESTQPRSNGRSPIPIANTALRAGGMIVYRMEDDLRKIYQVAVDGFNRNVVNILPGISEENAKEQFKQILEEIAEDPKANTPEKVKRKLIDILKERYLTKMTQELEAAKIELTPTEHFRIPVNKESRLVRYTKAAAVAAVAFLAGWLGTRTGSLETKLRNAQYQVVKQNEDIDNLTGEKQSLEKTLKEKDEQCEDIKEERDKVQGDLDQKTKDYTEALSQKDKVQRDLENITQDYGKLEQDLTNTKEVLEKSTKKYDSLNSKYLSLLDEGEKLLKSMNKIEKDLIDARKGYDASSLDAQKKLEEKEVAYKVLREKLVASETTAETVRNELIETSQRYGELQKVYGELQKAYKKATSQQTTPSTFVTVKDPTTKPDETPKIKPTTDPEKQYSPIEQLLRNCDGNSQYQRAVEAAMKQSQTERKDIQKKIEKLDDIERRLDE